MSVLEDFDRKALLEPETRARRTGCETSDCNSRARLGRALDWVVLERCVCVWGGEEGWLGVVRPNRAAPRLAGRGDPGPRGCPPYAPRAGGSQPAPRGGQGFGAAGRVLRVLSLVASPDSAAAFVVTMLVDCYRRALWYHLHAVSACRRCLPGHALRCPVALLPRSHDSHDPVVL